MSSNVLTRKNAQVLERRSPFVLSAHLKDAMTGDHKDLGDWHAGMPP
jgi:hypothetical protein